MFTRFNTILIPDSRYINELILLAKKITRDREEIFHIDNHDYFAHITLYSPEYPTKNINQIFEKVSEIAGRQRIIELDFETLFTGWGYIGLSFKPDREISKLHRSVLKMLNPLREGKIRSKYASEIKKDKYSNEQVKYIKEFGYHNILGSFYPHLSLARFSSEKIALEIKRKAQSYTIPQKILFSKLGVSEMGQNGTCTNVLKEFRLKK